MEPNLLSFVGIHRQVPLILRLLHRLLHRLLPSPFFRFFLFLLSCFLLLFFFFFFFFYKLHKSPNRRIRTRMASPCCCRPGPGPRPLSLLLSLLLKPGCSPITDCWYAVREVFRTQEERLVRARDRAGPHGLRRGRGP